MKIGTTMRVGAISLALLMLLSGCAKAPQQRVDDSAEILIQHLLRRVADSDKEVQRLRKELIERDNLWLHADIDSLEGRPSRKPPPLKGRTLSEEIVDVNERSSQHSLDAEELIEMHNRNHPESPYADLKELLRETCGDCAQERAIRDRQIEQERVPK
jgi:hypothetical protein